MILTIQHRCQHRNVRTGAEHSVPHRRRVVGAARAVQGLLQSRHDPLAV